MSSGSYFILYRKYNVKASDDVFNALVNRYVSHNKSNRFDKKTDDIGKDLPLVLDLNFDIKESEYDENTKTWKDIKDYSIEGQRKQYQAILSVDRTYVDELFTWHFCSSFTCLKNEWNVDPYSNVKSKFIVDRLLAEKILQACNYLLSEKWSTGFEKILNNEWIKILSTGNDSESYWKYVYRNDKKLLREVTEEENNSAEYDIMHLQQVMQTFTSMDENYTAYGKTEHILMYTAW